MPTKLFEDTHRDTLKVTVGCKRSECLKAPLSCSRWPEMTLQQGERQK